MTTEETQTPSERLEALILEIEKPQAEPTQSDQSDS